MSIQLSNRIIYQDGGIIYKKRVYGPAELQPNFCICYKYFCITDNMYRTDNKCYFISKSSASINGERISRDKSF